jgi:hypothetical protein
MTRRSAIGFGVVLVVVAVVALGAWSLAGGPAAQSTVSATPNAAAEELRAEANDPAGPYKLTFEFPKSVWAAGEPITARAELSYIGVGQSKITGAGGSPIGFSLDEVNGSRDMGGASTADCAAYTVGSLQPVATGLQKSGAWTPDDPNAAFWQAWFADRSGYTLPAGDWDITAEAHFSVGGCSGPDHHLKVTLRIHVTD